MSGIKFRLKKLLLKQVIFRLSFIFILVLSACITSYACKCTQEGESDEENFGVCLDQGYSHPECYPVSAFADCNGVQCIP